ncbi:probable endopolygalacturonase I [Dendroctonus ponderosae]|uniref:endo-polygalacturonase n=1 Tax=Dendroctonus ponderosae TaxID=77166 RepID=E7CIU2_DENPD|nr:probable endopolygalacturonase I [Dendroctonus ponderosae]AEE63283.1 unknown [Dendroctonus ponderosae]ERL88067.1 hypothetical protein D910_05456 [Dendroctonus ponderosae]KAH1028751.1 hypothetical protein HUJ05_002081 [Dendroctonus ponderosae]
MKCFILIGLIGLGWVVAILGASCTVSNYYDVSTAAETCDTLIIGDLVIPAETTLEINLKDGAKLIFDGHLTHEVAEWTGDLVHIKGKNVEISGTANHLLDGLGPQHWKGAGESTILRPKFMRIQVEDSTVKDLNIKNCPNNCVVLSKSTNLLVTNINIDNYDGYPGVIGANYAKNTDGFDVAGGSGIRVENSVVINQDDCVAVNGGSNMVFENLHCNGSHGLSFSIKNGDVSDIQFLNSKVEYSNNVIHIKTHNDGDTGSIKNVLYKNIEFTGIDKFAISIQENYPSGDAKANIPITNLTLTNIQGTMTGSNSMALQIVCAQGGCADWHFTDVSVSGAKKSNTCQEVPSGISC